MNNNGRYILDENKNPVPCEDLLTWGRWLETGDRIVKQDTFGDIRVSTVFLGLDHSFGGGEPLLFETMIFGGKHDQWQMRCGTWANAEKMHKTAVRKVVKEKL